MEETGGERDLHFKFLVLIFMVFSISLKLPTVNFPHSEPDELVYLALAENLIKKGQ